MLFDIFFARCSPRFPRALPLRCAALLLQRPSFSSPAREIRRIAALLIATASSLLFTHCLSLCAVFMFPLCRLLSHQPRLVNDFFRDFSSRFFSILFLCCDCINTVAKYRRRHSSSQHAHVIQRLTYLMLLPSVSSSQSLDRTTKKRHNGKEVIRR